MEKRREGGEEEGWRSGEERKVRREGREVRRARKERREEGRVEKWRREGGEEG